MAGEGLDGPFVGGFDFDCIDEFDLECGMPLEPLPGEGSGAGGFGAEDAPPPWVWLIVAFATAGATGLALRWAHRRYLSVAREPDTVYRRLRNLAAFGGLTGGVPRTPYQFGNQLGRRLPAHRELVDVIVEAYVRARYGGRTASHG